MNQAIDRTTDDSLTSNSDLETLAASLIRYWEFFGPGSAMREGAPQCRLPNAGVGQRGGRESGRKNPVHRETK